MDTLITDQTDVIRAFEVRHNQPEAGALLSWAVWTTDALAYLDRLDRDWDRSQVAFAECSPEIIDVAHVRWATGTCVTALDLCCAGLGRAFCGHSKPRELSLAEFDAERKSKHIESRRALLPDPAREWVDNVLSDAGYKQIKAARDWLTHSRVARHLTLGVPGPRRRLELQVGQETLGVRELVKSSRKVAVRHVTALFEVLPSI